MNRKKFLFLALILVIFFVLGWETGVQKPAKYTKIGSYCAVIQGGKTFFFAKDVCATDTLDFKELEDNDEKKIMIRKKIKIKGL